jgi:acyl carrier protein
VTKLCGETSLEVIFLIDEQTVREIIHNVIDELNRQLPPRHQVDKDSRVILIGDGGVLDSLGLTNFIVEIDQMVEERFGININLAEDIMSEDTPPFDTLESLYRYLLAKLRETDNG